jgi:hypothetical protein
MYSTLVLVSTALYILLRLCTVEQLQDLVVYFLSLSPANEMEGPELGSTTFFLRALS